MMEKRDLKADLELCNKATPGPWEFGPIYAGTIAGELDEERHRANRELLNNFREGWPHAIERAMLAETLLRDILPMAMWVSCMYKNEPEANPTTHCCIWNEVVKQIQEVLRDETR